MDFSFVSIVTRTLLITLYCFDYFCSAVSSAVRFVQWLGKSDCESDFKSKANLCQKWTIVRTWDDSRLSKCLVWSQKPPFQQFSKASFYHVFEAIFKKYISTSDEIVMCSKCSTPTWANWFDSNISTPLLIVIVRSVIQLCVAHF